MAPPAFAIPTPLATQTFKGHAVGARPPAAAVSVARMSVAADKFMNASQTREAKQAATPFGVYTVQCTEGTGGANTAESARLAVLARSFRQRQASPSARYADLYATRRAAVIAAAGSHVAEKYAVNFPARASAGVLGRAEAKRACSRYFGDDVPPAEDYMFRCVEGQYKMMKARKGVYETSCAEGRMQGDAETARVAALAARFRAGQMDERQKTQMRYNASLEAVYSGRGCEYKEKQYLRFPKMASAVRWGTGVYAANLGGVRAVMGGALATVEEQVKSENLDAYWPSFRIRPAVHRKRKPWMPSPLKNYSPMSTAAVAYGIKSQQKPFKESGYDRWSPGWRPKSSLQK